MAGPNGGPIGAAFGLNDDLHTLERIAVVVDDLAANASLLGEKLGRDQGEGHQGEKQKNRRNFQRRPALNAKPDQPTAKST